MNCEYSRYSSSIQDALLIIVTIILNIATAAVGVISNAININTSGTSVEVVGVVA